MISKINKIKNFGIFQNFTFDSSLATFGKYNLLYGWNGSGKSTLSRLFRCFELKEKHSDYINAEFEIEDDNSTVYDESFENTPLLKVFNTDFINDNLELEQGKTKPIIWIGHENKKLKDEIEVIKNKIQEKSDNPKNGLIIKSEKLNQNTVKKYNTFSDIGREIKTQFLGTMFASRYVNYNRVNAEKVWSQIDKTQLKSYILDKSTIESSKSKIQIGNKKDEIDYTLNHLSFEDYNDLRLKIRETIHKSITETVTIDRLSKHEDINEWVKIGKNLHEKYESKVCEYCGNIIDSERINDLDKHFSKAYENLMSEIQEKLELLNHFFIKRIEFDKSKLYSSDYAKCDKVVDQLNIKLNEINKQLETYQGLLLKKQKSPFSSIGFEISYDTQPITQFNTLVDEFNDLLLNHNKKIEEYDKIANEARILLEMHYVVSAAISKDLVKTISEISGLTKETEEIESEIEILTKQKEEKERELANDRLALDEININLERFLGRDEIKLSRIETGGYELKRSGRPAKNLSEAEKTAIALVYFIAKLKENDNKIEDTVIVLDDPISSFDSNHLFHANYFIKEECQSANQLFVLTHNFHFFSLLKDWATVTLGTQYYSVKAKMNGTVRKGIIENADNMIKHFSSEYHFLFAEIKKYIEATDKSYLNTHVISNLCRQLLESFLTFKYGRKKLDKCFDEITGFENLSKVRKFVNHYSHRANHGASMNGFNDNLFAEVESIVPEVLNLIEHVDKVHYDSMVNRINNS